MGFRGFAGLHVLVGVRCAHPNLRVLAIIRIFVPLPQLLGFAALTPTYGELVGAGLVPALPAPGRQMMRFKKAVPL